MKKTLKAIILTIALNIIPFLLIYIFCWSSNIECNRSDILSLYLTGLAIDAVIVGAGWGVLLLIKWMDDENNN